MLREPTSEEEGAAYIDACTPMSFIAAPRTISQDTSPMMSRRCISFLIASSTSGLITRRLIEENLPDAIRDDHFSLRISHRKQADKESVSHTTTWLSEAAGRSSIF
jgi:hypothetical protein